MTRRRFIPRIDRAIPYLAESGPDPLDLRMQSSFQRSIDSLGAIFDFVEEFFDQSAVTGGSRYVISMAIEELFTNMVKYNPDGAGEIQIRVERESDRAIIRLTDFNSEMFDITKTPEVDVDQPQRSAVLLG